MQAVKRKGKPALQDHLPPPKGTGNAYLFNGPQLGFSMPELFVEFELHSPTQNMRGVSAAGIPVLGIGHNGHLAWGFTSGLSDEDDLYAEKLTGTETYRTRARRGRWTAATSASTSSAPATDLPDLLDHARQAPGLAHRAHLPHRPRPRPGARGRHRLRPPLRHLGPRARDPGRA